MRATLVLLGALVCLTWAGETVTLNNANQWDTNHGDIIIGNSGSALELNFSQWIWGSQGGSVFYVWVKPNELPPYVDGGTVQLTFDFWQDSGNTYYYPSEFPTYPAIRVYGVTNLPDEWRWYPDNIVNNECWDTSSDGPCEVMFNNLVYNWIPSGSSNAASISVQYYATQWEAAQLLLEITLDGQPSRASGNNYYFSNIQWTIDESPNDDATSNLAATGKWSTVHEDVSLSNPSSGDLRLEFPQWAWGSDDGFTWYFWLNHGALPDLSVGTTWTFSFDVWQDSTNTYCSSGCNLNTVPANSEIRGYLVNDLPVGDEQGYWHPTNIQSDDCWDGAAPDQCTVLASATLLTGIPYGQSARQTVSVDLPNTFDSPMQIVLELTFPGQVSGTPNGVTFENIQISSGYAPPSTPSPAASAPASSTPSPSPVGPSSSASPSPAASPIPSPSSSPSSAPAQPCSPGWSEPVAVDHVPASGSVGSTWTQEGDSVTFSSASQWSRLDGQSDLTIGNANGNTLSLTIDQWNWGYEEGFTYYFWLDEGVLSRIISDRDYTLSFDLWQDGANTWYTDASWNIPASPELTMFVVDDLPDDSWKWYPDILSGSCYTGASTEDDACTIKYSNIISTATALGSANTVSVSHSFQVDLTSPAQILMELRLPGQAASNNGNTFYLSDITLTRAPRSRTYPTPLSGDVQYVDTVKAPIIMNGEQQVNCPHSRSDLVDWHDASIWSTNQVPTSGSVTLPANSAVLISSCSIPSGASFGTIYVPASSELIFGDADISLLVGNIIVDGHLWAGSETCRLKTSLTITLLDSAPDEGGMHGRKAISTGPSGSIDMHGKLFQQTWTRLASSAEIGDDRIQVVDDINWEVGQQIVVVTSILRDHEDNQNEVRTIAAIQGRRIQLDQPLNFFHYAGEEYQVEVALLTRRILVQGDAASESSRFGGHILSRGPVSRFSGVQAYRMGQTNVLGRYPFHFHMMGDSPSSYFQDCSVYHSYFRCFTVHGTNQTRVSRNTAFDVLGHCYYLEDGVEEENTLEYNLAAYPLPIRDVDFSLHDDIQQGSDIYAGNDLLIPADAAPSGFYISNAHNSFVGNTASGGFAAYSVINFPEPIGNFHSDAAYSGFSPQTRPFIQFYGNTAHSAGYQWARGGCIYVGGEQKYVTDAYGQEVLFYNTGRNARPTMDDSGSPTALFFDHTRSFICRRGLTHWGERVEVTNFEAHDVTTGLTIFGEAFLHHALIEGRTPNPLYRFPPKKGFQFYDTFVKTIISDVTFRNYEYAATRQGAFELENYVITSLTHDDQFKPQGINAAKAISFENVWEGGRVGNTIRRTGASRYFNIMDYDNTILEHPRAGSNNVILGSANDEYYVENDSSTQRIQGWWNLNGNDCEYIPEAIVWACTRLPENEIISLELEVEGVTNSYSWDPVGTVSQFGFNGQNNRRSTIITGTPGVTGVSGDYGWYVNFKTGGSSSPASMRVRTAQLPNVDGTKTYTILAMKYPAGASFDIHTECIYRPYLGDTVTQVSTFSAMYNDVNGLSYYVRTASNGEKWLMLKIVDRWWDDSDPASSDFYAPDEVYERDGMRLWKVWNDSYHYYIDVTCSGCSTASEGGSTFFTVTDEVPPSIDSMLA